MEKESTDSMLLSRRQFGEAMVKLLVPQSPETLKAVIAKLGMQPRAHGLDPYSGRGRVSLYEGLGGWLLATYFHWPRLASTSPENVLASARRRAEERRGGVADELTERMAYYLVLMDPRYGLDLRVLDIALFQHPELLEMTSDGPDVMRALLREYKRGLIATSLQRPVADVPLGDEFPEPEFDDQPIGYYGDEAMFAVFERAGLYDPPHDTDADLWASADEVMSKIPESPDSGGEAGERR